jgi:hypothetical protein
MLFKNSVRTAKRSHFTVTKINWLTLFKELIPAYTDNHTKHKHKVQSYWLLNQVVHIITFEF